jgi:hypothetical protein
MFSFKKSLVAFAGLSLFVCALATPLPLTGRGQGNSPGGQPQLGPRKFYLTQTLDNGSQALSACAAGYHMASLWEIFDPSNLKYDTTLGVTQADSGSGPPSKETTASGWIRTVRRRRLAPLQALPTAMPGRSVLTRDWGSTAWFSNRWDSLPPRLATDAADCGTTLFVWCIQD